MMTWRFTLTHGVKMNIFDKLKEISKQVPDEEWDKFFESTKLPTKEDVLKLILDPVEGTKLPADSYTYKRANELADKIMVLFTGESND